MSRSFREPNNKGALAYVNSLLDRDQSVHDLRVKWLKKFQEAVPAKIAPPQSSSTGVWGRSPSFTLLQSPLIR